MSQNAVVPVAKGTSKSRMLLPIVLLRGNQRTMADIARGAHAAAQRIRPAAANVFLCQLIVTVWLVVAKVHAKRGQAAALQKDLESEEGIPGRRGQDLWCRLLLHALADLGVLPTADRKYYRRHPGLLHQITSEHLKLVCETYHSLREMQRAFASSGKARSPEERIREYMSSMIRVLAENDDLDLPNETRDLFEELCNLFPGNKKNSVRASKHRSHANWTLKVTRKRTVNK